MGMPSVAPDVIMDFERPKTDHGFLRETFLKKTITNLKQVLDENWFP